ncbi:MAG: hypothetical protein R2818_15900 [Flavobacteriales bacterium]
MRTIALLVLLLPMFAVAGNDYHFAQVIHKGNVRRIDRHMKRFIEREGRDFKPASYMQPLGGAEWAIAGVYEQLRGQIGILEMDWDRCAIKPAIWPGTWTLGVVYRTGEGRSHEVLERCYVIQGGRMGTINIFGWRPRIRGPRDRLKVIGTSSCPGYIEAQHQLCTDRGF